MRTMKIRTALLGTALLVGGLAAPATAETDPAAEHRFEAQLAELNGSESAGMALVALRGREATVTVTTDGMSAGLPHAQHIHIGGRNECPTTAADRDGDGYVSTAEGQPAYGAVKVSLTTTGDVSDQSALAVKRFPVADEDERYTYTRTFALPDGVTAADVEHGVVVIHGIAELFGDRAAYDGTARSSLDDSLPLEATIPALCGRLLPEDDGIEILGIDGDDLLGIFEEDDDEAVLDIS